MGFVLQISALSVLLACIFYSSGAVPVQHASGPVLVKFIENVTMPASNTPIPQCKLRLSADQMKSGIPGENKRWRGGLYVQLDGRFSENDQGLINNALYDLYVSICIDILVWPVDANPSGDYVFINRGNSGTGCWSYVGKNGGRQELNLEAPGCVHPGVTMHETIHALGFFHEQSRPDRDQFVEVLWGNISPGTEHNFDRYADTITYDVPYDYTSIMHYNSHDFSSNGQPTLRAWNGQPVGSQYVLTGNDRTKINRMYGC